MSDIADKPKEPKCPKCRSKTFSFTVVTEEEFYSEVVNGKLLFKGQSSLANPIKAFGKCECGHEWRFRNIPEFVTD